VVDRSLYAGLLDSGHLDAGPRGALVAFGARRSWRWMVRETGSDQPLTGLAQLPLSVKADGPNNYQ